MSIMPKAVPRLAWNALLAMILLVPTAVHSESTSKRRSLCDMRCPSDETVQWECRTLRDGESLERLFGEQWVHVARFNRVDRRHVHGGVSIKVPKQIEDVESFLPLPLLYLAAEQEGQFILVNLSEQFLGAYEYDALRFAVPIVSGDEDHPTPVGEFRLTAAHRTHRSCLYKVEGTDRSYPMNYALRFHIDREGVSYWLHGRDLPGYPASHGCIGLYDEPMQKEQYGIPRDPELNDAKRLFEWVLGEEVEHDQVISLRNGPRMQIIGQAPRHPP